MYDWSDDFFDEDEAAEDERLAREEQEQAEADHLEASMEDYFEDRNKELYGHA